MAKAQTRSAQPLGTQVPGRAFRSAKCLIVLLLIGACSTPESAAENDLRGQIEAASVAHVFDTEGAYVMQYRVAKDLVAFELIKSDSCIVVGYDLAGNRRFRYGVPHSTYPRLLEVQVSEDGSTLVITESMDNPWWTKKVFDISGSLLFELPIEARILPSPTGDFFCTVYSDVTQPLFTIYDRAGDTVRTIPQLSYDWDLHFLNERVVIVANPDSLYFIDMEVGKITLVAPSNLSEYPWRPSITVSQFDSTVVVFNPTSISTFSVDGRELWRETFSDYLFSVAADDRGPWLALQFQAAESNEGYFMFLSTENPEERAVTPRTRDLGNCSMRPYPVSWLSAGILTFLGPPGASLYSLRSDGGYWSLFLSFDTITREPGPMSIVPGLYWRIVSETGSNVYLRAGTTGAPSLIRLDLERER